MQWGQIKLLFILSFLILDLFLLQQFIEKQSQDVLGQISTAEENIETELAEDGITIADGANPQEPGEVSTIKSSGSTFSEEILGQIEDMDEEEQTVEVLNENRVLKVELDDPVPVTEDNVIDKVRSLVPFYSQYSFWGWNEENGVALFFQKANDRTIYFNNSGSLLVTIEDGEITGYVATMLAFNEGEMTIDSEQDGAVIAPLNAVRTLHRQGMLQDGDEVTSMSIGYYTEIFVEPSEEKGEQVFAPAWKVTVNGERSHFVYALTGGVIDVEEGNFIEEELQTYDLQENPLESTAEENEESENN
ncbi:hypothetical protein GLW03_07905 [Halobacillus halophilus]|uniref:two-component system regulatory protein YycI n=1 Tax=Halobacillus halophilus TaxID=1570 RepID=UPI00136EB7A7|nr:two-component system regulatory protein YycI [Halobacillus halophilus]MYL29744.1 hypothetical protein [Halobacillus halophilus]